MMHRHAPGEITAPLGTWNNGGVPCTVKRGTFRATMFRMWDRLHVNDR